jgi:hypothetical protein
VRRLGHETTYVIPWGYVRTLCGLPVTPEVYTPPYLKHITCMACVENMDEEAQRIWWREKIIYDIVKRRAHSRLVDARSDLLRDT